MDYETKGPSKEMGVSPMPIYGVVASLATAAITIISKNMCFTSTLIKMGMGEKTESIN